MKNFISTLVLMLMFVAGVGAQGLSPLQRIDIDEPTGSNFCTAFSINAKEGYWISAAHCFSLPFDVYIAGEKINWTMDVNQELDLIIFAGPKADGEYRLAKRPPLVGDEVKMVGYLGSQSSSRFIPPPRPAHLTTVFGRIAMLNHNTDETIMVRWPVLDLYDMSCGGGMSGSPILDGRGEVVGVLVGGQVVPPYFCGSPPFEKLKEFGRLFWRIR